MPFDGNTRVTFASLAEAVQYLGITPIPMEELEAYKREQVRKHPSSLLWPVRGALFFVPILPLACAVGSAMGAAVSALYATNHHAAWLLCVAATGIGLVSAVGFLVLTAFTIDWIEAKMLHGPAKWAKTWGRIHDTPRAIGRIADRINELVPTATFRTGILTRDTVVVDPYLLAVTPAETICIGIWDDTGVVRLAEGA